MRKLAFASFTWPQNPEVLTHSYTRKPVYTKNAAGEKVISGIGPEEWVITGTGCFLGEGAIDSFRALAALFTEGVQNTLTDPELGDFSGYLTELEMTREPKENCISYKFRFVGVTASAE